MIRSLHTIAVAAAAALALPCASAAQAAPKRVGATLDMGYVAASGNTSTKTFSLGDNVTWNAATDFVVRQKLRAVYGENQDRVIANSLDFDVSGDYRVVDGVGVVVGAGFDRNRFAGVKRRYEQSVGLSWRFATQARDSVRFTGGVLWTQQRNLEDVQREFVAFRGTFAYRRPIGGNAMFSQSMEAIPNIEVREDWRFNSETGISAALTKALALKLVYTVRYDNMPEPKFKDTDRIISTGLQVTF